MEIKEPPSIEELTTGPKEFTPTMGQEITIQRTSGHIEGGWKIHYMNEEKLNVTKFDPAGKEIEKTVLRGDVERFNRLPRIDDIATSKNIEQLKFTITKLGGLQGTKGFNPAEYILSCIDNVYEHNASEESLGKITRTGDLRDTVERIVLSKTENKQ